MNELNVNDINIKYYLQTCCSQPYIASFLEEDSFVDSLEEVIRNLEILFRTIYNYYSNSSQMIYSNMCGPNSRYICNNLKQSVARIGLDVNVGKIVIVKWNSKENIRENKPSIEEVYGNQSCIIDASYHALGFTTLYLSSGTELKIAIETVSKEPYKLQFYIASTKTRLKKLLKARYLCRKVNITYKYSSNEILDFEKDSEDEISSEDLEEEGTIMNQLFYCNL